MVEGPELGLQGKFAVNGSLANSSLMAAANAILGGTDTLAGDTTIESMRIRSFRTPSSRSPRRAQLHRSRCSPPPNTAYVGRCVVAFIGPFEHGLGAERGPDVVAAEQDLEFADDLLGGGFSGIRSLLIME
ncbi:MAG: hypothetical protein WCO94_16920 [Verrucomicrobiota bacterium]